MISLNEQQEYYNARWRTFEYANRLKMARAIAILGAMHRLKLNKPRIIRFRVWDGVAYRNCSSVWPLNRS